ncbi:MAG: SLBB domain-containing protein [Treponema sp.]|jgi:electron transport complex protein RnfC|nr:SLBB domain-containing protein [Treponema sp.]
MKVYSFPRGGLPYDDSTAPGKEAVVNAYLPTISIIPLGDSLKKAYPVVSIGECVKEGMLIGRGAGSGDVNIQSSVPGRVLKKVSWKDKDGLNNEALMIKLEGSFERLGRREEILHWNGLSGYDLQKIISDYGIVEMENFGRSLSEMISSARREKDKLTLVVRCVFDDPWLIADYALCRDNIRAVVDGAAIVAKACMKVNQIIFAVSRKEKELGDMLISEAGSLEYPVSLVLTGSRYPQHNNRELELALRAYEKKEGLNLGNFLIFGPAVLSAVHDAVVHKKPILDRYVAVGGAAIKNPQIMKVRIGTRIGEVIDQCGGFSEAPAKIVVGSPLSGREISYLNEPVGKTCYAIVAMTKSQVSTPKQQNCINCGECRSVCPVGLDPQIIYKQTRAMEIDNASAVGCHGCGCCKIVCPSALPLLETILEKNQEAVSA